MPGKRLQAGGRLGFAGIETRILHLPMAEPRQDGSVADIVAAAAEAGFNGVAITVYANGRICWPDPPGGRRPKQWPDPAPGLVDLLPSVCSAASQAGLLVYGWASLLSWDESVGGVPRLLRRWQAETELSDAHRDNTRYLCSNRPEVRRFLGDVLSAVVSAYPVDGMILDGYARPGQYSGTAQTLCRCAACSAAVDQALLFDLRKMTAEPDDDRYRRYARWQVDRVGDFLEGLVCRMSTGRRGLRMLLEVTPEAESHAAMLEWMEQGLVHGAVHHDALTDGASSRALLRLACRQVRGNGENGWLNNDSQRACSDGLVIRYPWWPDTDSVMQFGSLFGGAAAPAEGDPVASVLQILDSAGLDERRGPEAGALRHVREVLDPADARHPDLLADLASDCWHAASGAPEDLASAASAAARLLQLAALL